MQNLAQYGNVNRVIQFLSFRTFDLRFKNTTLLTNSIGVIDSSYRGEVKARLINLGKNPITIERGERFCQMVITNCYLGSWDSVADLSELSETERGTGGFGSTGRK